MVNKPQPVKDWYDMLPYAWVKTTVGEYLLRLAIAATDHVNMYQTIYSGFTISTTASQPFDELGNNNTEKLLARRKETGESGRNSIVVAL